MDAMGVKLTREQGRLLYLIHLLTRSDSEDEVVWVKDLPLKALLYQGIVHGIFDWDYAPQSVLFHGRRKFINVTQEGEDDINDLREIGFVDKLRLSTSEHTHINAYRLSKEGLEAVEGIPEDDQSAVEDLIICPNCQKARDVFVEASEAYFICKECNVKTPIDLLGIEDVPYITEPFMPRIALLEEVVRHGD